MWPQVLRTWLLTLEHRHGNGQQERLPQGINGLEHADVLDQGTVPQETQEDGQEDDVDGKNDRVIQELLLATGLQNVEHLFY